MRKQRAKLDPQIRFWSKVNKSTGLGPDGTCWEWIAANNGVGYGRFVLNGKLVYPHRYIYEQTNGPITINEIVMHICNNPKCINPDHLKSGTQKDNQKYMSSCGRQVFQKNPEKIRGENNGMAILKESDIYEIRNLRKSGFLLKEIAVRYGVSLTKISQILNGKAWAHIH